MSNAHKPDPARKQTEPIAIIGMACRFPGANNPQDFWDNLKNGVESLSHFTDEELLAGGIKPSKVNDPSYVKTSAILDDITGFDTEFFDVPPAEAEVIDPQHRILMECAWEAMESAGYPPSSFPGKIGVYAGSRVSEYKNNNLDPIERDETIEISPIVATQRHWNNDTDFLATRISFKLNLTGPAMTIQTACSTALVAVHLGCQSILTGESDMALAGRVSGPTGETRPFSSSTSNVL
jgi:acyl transferase domain-containing protein